MRRRAASGLRGRGSCGLAREIHSLSFGGSRTDERPRKRWIERLPARGAQRNRAWVNLGRTSIRSPVNGYARNLLTRLGANTNVCSSHTCVEWRGGAQDISRIRTTEKVIHSEKWNVTRLVR